MSVPLGKEICPPGGSGGILGLHTARGGQGPSSGQMPPPALSPPEMLLSLASNAHRDWKEKSCATFCFVHKPVFSPASTSPFIV